MIGFFEQFNRNYTGLRLDPDRDVVGEMLAEKHGTRFRDRDGEIEMQFLSRPLQGGEGRSYNASMCIRILPGTEDRIRSFRMKHWVETEKGTEPADILMTDGEFLRGIALLQEYLDRVAVRGNPAECRWRETA